MYELPDRLRDSKLQDLKKLQNLTEDCEPDILYNLVNNKFSTEIIKNKAQNNLCKIINKLCEKCIKSLETNDFFNINQHVEIINKYFDFLDNKLQKEYKAFLNNYESKAKNYYSNIYINLPENLKSSFVKNKTYELHKDNLQKNKDALKIAVIIMGDYRGISTDISLKTIKHFFDLKKTYTQINMQTDFFIHNWSYQDNKAARVLNTTDIHTVEKKYTNVLGKNLKNCTFTDPFDKTIQEKFTYLTYLTIPPIIKFTKKGYLGGTKIPYDKKYDKAKIFKIAQKMFGQYESQQKAYEYIKQYEFCNDIKYDIIVRLRSDNAIFGFGDFDSVFDQIGHEGQYRLFFDEVPQVIDTHLQGNINKNKRYKIFTQRMWMRQGDLEIQEHTWLGKREAMIPLMDNWYNWLEIWLTSNERKEKLEYKENFDTHHVWAGQIFNIAHRHNQDIIGEIYPHLLLDYSQLARPNFDPEQDITLSNLKKYYDEYDNELSLVQKNAVPGLWELSAELPNSFRDKWAQNKNL